MVKDTETDRTILSLGPQMCPGLMVTSESSWTKKCNSLQKSWDMYMSVFGPPSGLTKSWNCFLKLRPCYSRSFRSGSRFYLHFLIPWQKPCHETIMTKLGQVKQSFWNWHHHLGLRWLLVSCAVTVTGLPLRITLSYPELIGTAEDRKGSLTTLSHLGAKTYDYQTTPLDLGVRLTTITCTRSLRHPSLWRG